MSRARVRGASRAGFGTWREALRQRLDRQLDGIEDRLGTHPELGWIRTIREALGVTGPELAVRLGVSRQRVSRIEQAEVEGTIPLSTLERVAAALHCRVRYILLPDQPLQQLAVRYEWDRSAGAAATRRRRQELQERQERQDRDGDPGPGTAGEAPSGGRRAPEEAS